MRHRRAERCVLRAEMALEAGLEDEAFEALEEADRLNPGDPRVRSLKIAVDERMAANMVAYQAAQQAADEAEHAARRRRVMQFAAAALLFLTVGVAAYWLTPNDRSTSTGAATTSSTADATRAAGAMGSTAGDAPPSTPPPSAAVQQTDPPTAIATGGQVSSPTDRSSAVAPGNPERALFEESARPVPLPPRTPPLSQKFGIPDTRPAASTTPLGTRQPDPATTPVAAPPAPPEPAPALPEPPSAPPAGTVSLERMGERLATSNVPVTEAKPPSPAPAPAEPPADPAAVEEARVRAALARYEAAYSGLNAAAAQAVWPGVDERSLARAFETLQSQQVSLGRCSVQVQGTTASANCSGSISWTPKVGGGRQTEARQWRFQLANTGRAWQITRAEAR